MTSCFCSTPANRQGESTSPRESKTSWLQYHLGWVQPQDLESSQYRPRIRREPNTARQTRQAEQIQVEYMPTEEVNVSKRKRSDKASKLPSPGKSPILYRRSRHKALHWHADDRAPDDAQRRTSDQGTPTDPSSTGSNWYGHKITKSSHQTLSEAPTRLEDLSPY